MQRKEGNKEGFNGLIKLFMLPWMLQSFELQSMCMQGPMAFLFHLRECFNGKLKSKKLIQQTLFQNLRKKKL